MRTTDLFRNSHSNPEMPEAHFASIFAAQMFVVDAVAYNRAVTAYEHKRDEFALYEALSALGYDHDEIEWHRRYPGQHKSTLYL